MTDYHWRGFILCQCICWGILASWLLPTTRTLWDAVDHTVFFALNSTLAPHSLWGAFWALLGNRAADLLPALMMAPFLLIPGLLVPRSERIRICLHLFLLLVILVVWRAIANEVIEALEFKRLSPSRVLQPVVALSELYPEFGAKDGSSRSFPGDHAAVLILVSVFLLTLKVNRWSPVIIAIAVLFALPRLFAGAHWFSDVAVGGTLIAGQAIAFGCFTPWPGRWATRLTQCIQHHVPARWQKYIN